MPPHPITNFEIQKYYQNKPKFNGVCSRDNLPKISDGVYVLNPDEQKSTGTYWIALNVNGNNKSSFQYASYFDSFGVKHIPKEIKKFIGNKSLKTSIYRIQAYSSILFYWNY